MKIDEYKLRLKRYSQVINLRYNIKREYFTVAIPVILGILIVAFALSTGHTFPMGGDDDEKAPVQMTEAELKEQAYEELVAQIEAQENGENTSNTTNTTDKKEDENEEEKKDDMVHILVHAVLVAIIPYSIDTYRLKKKQNRKEVSFSEFLFKMSELMRGGIDPVKSVIDLAKTDLGEMQETIEGAASKLILGYSFSDAMEGVAKDLKSKLVGKYINVVVEAAYTGGDVADLMQRTSEDMRAVIGIKREKEASLKQYIVIFYLAQGIIIMLTYLLSTSLLPMLQGAGSEILGGSGDVSNINFQRGFFHLILINGFFGGLIIGQISEGEIKHGLKHSAVLLIASYLACTSLILPTMGVGDAYSINLVSGNNQETIPGAPVPDPIAFNVTDAQGNPAADTFVKLSISPSGMVPGVASTDEDGMVYVTPSIGDQKGTYTLTATVGNNMSTAKIITSEFED